MPSLNRGCKRTSYLECRLFYTLLSEQNRSIGPYSRLFATSSEKIRIWIVNNKNSGYDPRLKLTLRTWGIFHYDPLNDCRLDCHSWIVCFVQLCHDSRWRWSIHGRLVDQKLFWPVPKNEFNR
jgi:hypothetical protein